eukprot:2205946-Rhodomonas_salina.1
MRASVVLRVHDLCLKRAPNGVSQPVSVVRRVFQPRIRKQPLLVYGAHGRVSQLLPYCLDVWPADDCVGCDDEPLVSVLVL